MQACLKTLFYLFFFIPCLGWSYPWFDLNNQPKSKLIIDNQSSFFLRSKTWFVEPHLDFSYRNTIINFDFSYRYSVQEKKSYYRLSELSITFPFIISDYWTFSIGMKAHNWSSVDSYWNLGLWQPRYLIDPLRPVQIGMPGFYVRYDGPVILTAYASYLFVPDVINYPSIKDGKLVSQNPFLQKSSFSSVNLDLIELPEFKIDDFIQPALALQLLHELPYSELMLSYAYKPMNQLHYSAQINEIDLSSTLQFSNVIQALRYSIVHHHLGSLEARIFPLRNFLLYGNISFEKSEFIENPKNWISDQLRSQISTSTLVNYRTWHSPYVSTDLTFSYLKIFGAHLEQTKNNNHFTKDMEFLFGKNFDWKDAISFALRYRNDTWFSGYRFKFRINYALDNKMFMINFSNEVGLFEHIQTYFSGDMLFRTSGDHPSASSSAIIQSKNLSRFLMGARYVF